MPDDVSGSLLLNGSPDDLLTTAISNAENDDGNSTVNGPDQLAADVNALSVDIDGWMGGTTSSATVDSDVQAIYADCGQTYSGS